MPWGGPKLTKIDFFRPRGPGPPETEFFEISHFFAKTSTFRTPKSTPKMGPYRKFHFPQKRLYFSSNGGGQKCHFLGGRGADRSDRKM
jgi:hypothetical protein